MRVDAAGKAVAVIKVDAAEKVVEGGKAVAAIKVDAGRKVVAGIRGIQQERWLQ